MPEEALSASSDAAQSPSKITQCLGGCGALVPYRTNSKVYCGACKIEKKRESSRKAAEVQRRKRGIQRIKGTTFACIECGCDALATSGNAQKYCQDCSSAVALRVAKDRSFSIDPRGTRERFIGRSLVCVDCSSEFIANRRRERCEECTDKNKRKPHNGTASCKQCGAEFQSGTRKKIYCDACAEERRAESSRRCALKIFNKMRGDPAFDLNILMRSGMRHSLSAVSNRKDGTSWTKFVDYTVGELRKHLERQFLPGMSWENRGEYGWHIDHILPIASFDYDGPDHPEFKACWALTNLRPLWGPENIAKKDKILYLI